VNVTARFPDGDVSFRFKGRADRRHFPQASTDIETGVDLREFVAEQASLPLPTTPPLPFLFASSA
jgi:hypothetical protein